MLFWVVSVEFHLVVIAECSKRMFLLDLTAKERVSVKKEKPFLHTPTSAGGTDVSFFLLWILRATLFYDCRPGKKQLSILTSSHLLHYKDTFWNRVISRNRAPTTHRKADPRYISFYLVTTNKISKIGPTHQELISYLVYPCAVGAYYN